VLVLEHRKNDESASATFSFHRDKIKHHSQPVANHPAVKIFGRKRVQGEVSRSMRKRSSIAS
jgi:hypothetical protein